MRKRIFPVVLVGFLLLCVANVRATGFRIYGLGAKAATLAGAFAGRADNTSAIYYNPAGLAFQSGLGFRLNIVYFDLKHSAYVPNEDATYNSGNSQLRGSLFVAYTFIDRISVGAGYFQPYTMETDWQTEWPGITLVRNSRLNASYFRLVLSFKLIDRLSVGGGFDIVKATTHWNYNRIFSSPNYTFEHDVATEIDTSGTGYGFAAGILFRPSDKIGIGVRYQHKVKIAAEGRTKFSQSGGGILVPHPEYPLTRTSDLLHDFYSYTNVTSTVILPAEFVVGITVAPIQKLNFHLDANWTGWSEFKGLTFNTLVSEEELQQSFYNKYGDFYGILPDWASQGITMEMKDAWSFKFGTEYYLKEVLSLRAGYSRNQSAISDEYLNPFLPVLPRSVISFGAGYDGPVRTIYDQSLIGSLTFDVFVQYVMGESRTSGMPGYEYTYKSSFWIVGCGVGLKL